MSTYERSLNDHLRPGPTGTYNRPQSMSRRSVGRSSTGGRESLQINAVSFSSSPRPLTMVQSRPSSAHQLATKGQRLSLMMQATVRPRSGSGVLELSVRVFVTYWLETWSCFLPALRVARCYTHTHTHTHTHRPAEHRATSSLHSMSHGLPSLPDATTRRAPVMLTLTLGLTQCQLYGG